MQMGTFRICIPYILRGIYQPEVGAAPRVVATKKHHFRHRNFLGYPLVIFG